MAKLTVQHVKEQDIDWFCLINGQPTHIASMGGVIPEKFRDTVNLSLYQDEVARMEPFAEVRLIDDNIQTFVEKGYEYLQDMMINDAVINANRNNPGFTFLEGYNLPVRLFASTFVEKARRGFRSFAKAEGVDDNEYVLIAEPVDAIEYKGGNRPLVDLECEVKDDGNRIVIP